MKLVSREIGPFPKKMTPEVVWKRGKAAPMSESMAHMPEGSQLAASKGFDGMLVGVKPLWPNVDVSCEVKSEAMSQNGGVVTVMLAGSAVTAAAMVDMSEAIDAESYLVVGAVSLVDIKWAASKSGIRIISVDEVERSHKAVFCDAEGVIRKQDEELIKSAIGADLSWSKGKSSLISWWEDVVMSLCIICMADGGEPTVAPVSEAKPARVRLKEE